MERSLTVASCVRTLASQNNTDETIKMVMCKWICLITSKIFITVVIYFSWVKFLKPENINQNFIIICGNQDADTPSIFVGLERNGLDHHWFIQQKETWQQRMNFLQWFKWPSKFQVTKCNMQKKHVLHDFNSRIIDKKWHYITEDRWWVVAISAQIKSTTRRQENVVATS